MNQQQEQKDNLLVGNKFCVYLTIYSGKKLPPFYIGSSSVEKVNNGYRGSVSSKKYSEIWKLELKENPSLFRTKVIKSFPDRKSALDWERKIQETLKVVSNPLYCNLWIACGIFGYSVKGKDHHCYGKKLWTDSNPNPFKGKKHSEETRRKMSLKSKNKKVSEETRKKQSLARKGVSTGAKSEETRKKIADRQSLYIWITNGLEVIRHLKSEPIPDGFIRGRLLNIKKKKRCFES